MNMKPAVVQWHVVIEGDESFARVANSDVLTDYFHDEPVIVDDVMYTDDGDYHCIILYLTPQPGFDMTIADAKSMAEAAVASAL